MKISLSSKAVLRVVNSMLRTVIGGVNLKALPTESKVIIKQVYAYTKNKELLYYYLLSDAGRVYKSTLYKNNEGLGAVFSKHSSLNRAIFHKCVKVVPVVSSKGIQQLSKSKTKN